MEQWEHFSEKGVILLDWSIKMEDIGLNVLSDDWMGINDIIVYGFGRVAQRNMKKLIMDFHIMFAIDNNPDWQLVSNKWNIEIKSLEEARESIQDYKIVVTTSSLAYESIKKDLIKIGKEECKDFCRLETFMLEWYWKNKRQVCISQVLSTVTTRCTFRCKHCSNLMPYFTKQYDYNAEDIVEDLRLLFGRVDYLASYYLIGGEPLLNKNLPNIISEVCKNFSNRIGYIQIITNGSIVPNEQLIKVMKQYDIKIRISDYTKKIPYKKKLEEVILTFENEGIEYSISDYKIWMDLGFPHENLSISGDMQRHMLKCSQGCHSVNDKKFYYCSTLWDAEKSGLHVANDRDYIDLQNTTGNFEEDKIQMLTYCSGIIEGGCISLCTRCRGFGADNAYKVEVAEQMR